MIDPKIHQTTAIYLRYSQQLLLKKKRAIRRLGIEKKKIACSSKCKLGILTVDLLDKNDIAISKKKVSKLLGDRNFKSDMQINATLRQEELFQIQVFLKNQ